MGDTYAVPPELRVHLVALSVFLCSAAQGCLGVVGEVNETCPEPPCTALATCANNVQDGDETGVDCGGSCAACTASGSCNNRIQDGNETGLDCGGDCPPCAEPGSCDNQIQDGNETGVDCGGFLCEPCEQATACDNNVQDGDETGVDCGGSCQACEQAATCDNDVQDGDETGVDCGGSCPSCIPTDPADDCVAEDPPAAMQETIELTWKEMTGGFEGRTGARPVSASVETYDNSVLRQLFDAEGALQFCIRWESRSTLTSSQRNEIEVALERWANAWFTELEDYNCWPFNRVPVKVVGVAVADRSLADWDDDEMPVYVGDYFENAPQCSQKCGRFFHRDNDYSNCPGGAADHYDMSLWLTDDFGGGAVGGDWGQRMAPQTFMGNMSAENNHIWMHEFGHGLGFPDYYNWNEWAPGVSAPACVMNAGAAAYVTQWDAEMLRYLWNKLKTQLLP